MNLQISQKTYQPVIQTCLMYHAAGKIEFQPFKRSYSQLTFQLLIKIILPTTAAAAAAPGIIQQQYDSL